jgi:hypothetical protein
MICEFRCCTSRSRHTSEPTRAAAPPLPNTRPGSVPVKWSRVSTSGLCAVSRQPPATSPKSTAKTILCGRGRPVLPRTHGHARRHTQPGRHPDVDDCGPAISVDGINTAGVSAGHLALFGVVSRTRFRRFRRSIGFLSQVRFPAAPLRISWSGPQALASFRFPSTCSAKLAVIW